MTAAADASTRSPRRGHSALRLLRDAVVIVVVAVLVAWGVKSFLLRSFSIPSTSMVHTLLVEDRVLVNELAPDLSPLQRGDIIVFRDTDDWLEDAPAYEPTPLEWFADTIGLSSTDSHQYLIKRVIGLPGDRVTCCDAEGRIEVNGVAIDEPYLDEPSMPASASAFDVVVPEGRVWVMGDNRNRSADSRAHQDRAGGGTVGLDSVVGRAFLITWPLDRFGVLDRPDAQFSAVPDAAANG